MKRWKFFSKVKDFQEHFQFLAFLRWLSFWWIPSRISFMNLCKTHCSISQSLDDIHASLHLKYMLPFLLNLLVAWLVRTCYLWFGSSSSFFSAFSSPKAKGEIASLSFDSSLKSLNQLVPSFPKDSGNSGNARFLRFVNERESKRKKHVLFARSENGEHIAFSGHIGSNVKQRFLDILISAY